MKLYDAAWAPSPRRVRMFLAEKGVEIDRQVIDLATGENLQDAYLAINPRGTVPALRLDNGTVIDESAAICRYIEALHPEPALFGTNATEIALIEAWTRRIEADGYAAVVYAFRNRSRHMEGRALNGHWPPVQQIPELVERGRLMWPLFVDMLDAHLADRQFVATDGYSFADLSALATLDFAKATRLSDGEFPPALARWYDAVSTRPSAAA
jgi:glutathione S-transferase